MHRILIGCLLLLAPASAFAGDDDVKAGKWETTVTTKIEGMPVQPQTVTTSRCMTEADVKDRKKMVPSNPQDADCKLEDFKIVGNKMSWRMECPKSKASGSGEMSMQPVSYDGTMTMTINNPGGPQMKVNVSMKGKRVGDCK